MRVQQLTRHTYTVGTDYRVQYCSLSSYRILYSTCTSCGTRSPPRGRSGDRGGRSTCRSTPPRSAIPDRPRMSAPRVRAPERSRRPVDSCVVWSQVPSGLWRVELDESCCSIYSPTVHYTYTGSLDERRADPAARPRATLRPARHSSAPPPYVCLFPSFQSPSDVEPVTVDVAHSQAIILGDSGHSPHPKQDCWGRERSCCCECARSSAAATQRQWRCSKLYWAPCSAPYCKTRHP